MKLSEQVKKQWHCILCHDIVTCFFMDDSIQHLKSSYRLSNPDNPEKFGRICKDCYNSAENPTRKSRALHNFSTVSGKN